MGLLLTHTQCCLGQELFTTNVASWPWPSDALDIQHCSLTKFCFSVITFPLVNLLHTHTQCCFGRDLDIDMPHCDL